MCRGFLCIWLTELRKEMSVCLASSTAGLGLVQMVLQSTQTIFNLYFECFKSFTSCLHFLLIKQITKQLHKITSMGLTSVLRWSQFSLRRVDKI